MGGTNYLFQLIWTKFEADFSYEIDNFQMRVFFNQG